MSPASASKIINGALSLMLSVGLVYGLPVSMSFLPMVVHMYSIFELHPRE